MFSQALVRTPCQSLVKGLTSANLGLPDYEKALQQHQQYIAALEECGLVVTCLEADGNFPDSTFVEDTALLTEKCAIITRPGAASRRGETQSMATALMDFCQQIEIIEAPGTIEAGDIMRVADCFYIGLSARTNSAGAAQMIKILKRYGYRGICVELTEMLHLKTGVNSLENNKLLVTGEFINKSEFDEFEKIVVAEDESYAANSLWINGNVLVPAGHPKTRKLIADAGYSIIDVDVSEFEKLDGGLSCLSLRF